MAAGIVLMWTWGWRGRRGSVGLLPLGPAHNWLLPQDPAHLNVGLSEQLDDASVGCGHHTVPIDLDDAVSHADTPTFSDATPKEAADLGGEEGPCCSRGWDWGHPTPFPGSWAGSSRCHPPRKSPAAHGRVAGG